jgi:hypothetical protein
VDGEVNSREKAHKSPNHNTLCDFDSFFDSSPAFPILHDLPPSALGAAARVALHSSITQSREDFSIPMESGDFTDREL